MIQKTIIHHFVIMEVIILLLCSSSCTAKVNKTEKDYTPMHNSEMMLRKSVGDSIFRIIMKARHVEISTDSCSVKKLNAKDRTIVRYILADSCNYTSDTKVYGIFIPYLSIKFRHYRKTITVLYDFRLHKWMMKGANDELLCMYDLKSTEILRFALLAMPNEQYLNEFTKLEVK